MTTLPADPKAEQRRRDAERLALLLLIGSSLGWTDRQLITLSAVTPASIQRATSLWQTLMPPLSRNLLTAGQWSASDQAYVVNGSPLNPSEIKSLSLTFSTAVADKLQRDTAAMVNGEQEIGEWQQAAGATVKAAITAQAAFAAGGTGELLPADTQAIAADVRYSLKKLEGFAHQVEMKDSRAGTKSIVLNRVRLYAASANKTFERQRRTSHARVTDGSGLLIFTDERNVLSNAEHCSTSNGVIGCLEVTAMGWRRIGTLPAIGDRRCSMNCRCRFEFRKRP